jgi:hypothetical protein
VSFATANSGAVAPADYTSKTGSVTIPAGATSKALTVTVRGDGIEESDETFIVDLSNPVNATLGDSQGVGTILNDDVTPALSINDVSVAEGNGGTKTATFTVSLSVPSNAATSVTYATADGSALAPGDYTSKTGSVTIAAGATSKTVTVGVKGDGIEEPNETFTVNLSNPVNATLGDAQGVGTIVNDDVTPTISIDDPSIVEGDSATQLVTFTISLSGASNADTRVSFATANGSATAGPDYLARNGAVTISAGALSKIVTVKVKGDLLDEVDETFFLVLSNPTNATIADGQGACTIVDND